MFSGKVIKADPEKTSWGSIKPDEPVPAALKGKTIVFKQDKVNGEPCSTSDDIWFTVDETPGTIVAATAVWHQEDVSDAGSESDSESDASDESQKNDSMETDQPAVQKESGPSLKPQSRYRGRIVNMLENYGFLKSLSPLPSTYNEQENIYFSLKDSESAGLALQKDDELEYTLGAQDREKPRAFKVKLVKCSPRKAETVLQYLNQVLAKLQGSHKEQEECCMQLLTCTAVWQGVGDCETVTEEGTLLIMECVERIANSSTVMQTHVCGILNQLSSTKFLNPRLGPLAILVKNRGIRIQKGVMQSMHSFSTLLVKHVPDKALAIVTILKPLIGFSVPGLEELLYNTLRTVVHESSDSAEDMEWNELPKIPTLAELLNGPIENTVNLRKVKEKGTYSSADDYLDIYFRLLRADCFASLCSGIRAFMAGNLDHRDMNVYRNVQLVGLKETQMKSGLGLAVRVIPCRKGVNWETTSCLMFGNLLCLTPAGTFKDPIWATVLDRNTETLKKTGVVTIELAADCNKMSDADAVIALSNAGPTMIMAESPTYYKAYQPVLAALQNMKPEDIPFQRTIIDSKIPNTPTYLPPLAISEATKHESCSSLDSSQKTAFDAVLRNEIGIIQGPPGTGKTFIGLKILEYIFSMSTCLDGPVLVLTYKNRALDDFLKDLAIKYHGKVARVGGRSNEPILERCNLTEIKKIHRKSAELFNQWKLLDSEANILKIHLRQGGNRLNRTLNFCSACLIEQMTVKQLCSFLQGYDWHKLPDKFQFQSWQIKERNAGKRRQMVQNFIERLLSDNCKSTNDIYVKHVPTPDWITDVKTVIEIAVKDWIPSVQEFTQVELQLSQNILTEVNTDEIFSNQTKDDLEDRDAEEEQQERVAVMEKGQRTNKLQDLFMFERKTNVPKLFANASGILQDINISTLLNTQDLWKLSNLQKIYLVQHLLMQESLEAKDEFQKTLKSYSNISSAKNEIENRHKAAILKDMKVIGMTITGASIHNELLRQVKPEIVLVEEAAEVLEPQLLAVLGPWVKHLVLIGDHQQLRPPVESYSLRKDYNFDVSMMERLINNKMPFATLAKQNRMRVEFAELLLDIYPDLESNLQRVSKNTAPNCMEKSMFFWNHTYPENNHQGRSYSNDEEAERALKLAMFFIQQGISPGRITILAAYQGQTSLIRRLLRQAEKDDPSFFSTETVASTYTQMEDGNTEKSNERVIVHTIDNYQGDENDIIIVSLVRSSKPGFLSSLNRRCVVQSRAKCGMYFIGNKETFSSVLHWSRFLEGMAVKGCVGEIIVLQCPRHPNESKVHALNAKEVTFGAFCKKQCAEYMPCGIHPCRKTCQPAHRHLRCQEKVTFHFMKCQHPGRRYCFQNESQVMCMQIVPYQFTCGHSVDKACHKDPISLTCKAKCPRKLKCGHLCDKLCGEECIDESCKVCKQIREEKERQRLKAEEQEREKIRQQVKKEIEKIRKAPASETSFSRRELKPDGESAAEYLDVEDRVKKYVQSSHKWFPTVTNIEKVTNSGLELKWLEAKSRMVDPTHSSLKFHGTSKEAVDAIIKTGFLMPKKPGMYGRGIYFATDASKSAQEIYTKGSNMLLLCDVLLGRVLTVKAAKPDATLASLRANNFDSLFAKRDTASSGGVRYDEFVVFDPAQAFPRYVIHYSCTSARMEEFGQDTLTEQAMRKKDIFKIVLQSRRSVDMKDPKDFHFRIAESQFLRLKATGRYSGAQNATIKSIDYYVNPALVRKFEIMQQRMKMKYGNSKESEYILAFHGTPSRDVMESIMKENFRLDKIQRAAYGRGIYFSEFPDVSLGYGQQLLLCKVLPGKERQPGSDPQDMESIIVRADEGGRGEMVVIGNVDQILPCYVINL